MTNTTKDVETRLRVALDATIPQLLSEETPLRGSTGQPEAANEEPVVLAFRRSEATELRSPRTAWRLIGAAAAGVILVGGLAITQRGQGDPAPAAQSPVPAPESDATEPLAATAEANPDVTVTTIATGQPVLIARDAVVCVAAGATEGAVSLCVDELGGMVVRATKPADSSFVMSVDPANPSHRADTASIGNELRLPVVEFDASYLPATTSTGPSATTYLVLGRDDAGYTP